MQPPDGDPFVLTGEFRRVQPPARLSYTFGYEEPDADDRETVVDLSLRDLGESTAARIDQGPFLTEARRALHTQGLTPPSSVNAMLGFATASAPRHAFRSMHSARCG
jgi:uncharacterized protein YndB with AHSA1/START domain